MMPHPQLADLIAVGKAYELNKLWAGGALGYKSLTN